MLTIPKSSFVVTVTVFDDNGDVFVETSNVFIYEIKLDIWQPKWMSPNQVNLPSLTQPLRSAQTFVNTDNDDNDDFFDIDDNDVPKGDNELLPIKAYLRLIGADFPTINGNETANKGMILKPDQIDADFQPIAGANTVKIWKQESKSILFDNYKLSTKNQDFSNETIANTEWLTFKGWVEGVVAHTAPYQAQFGFAIGNDISADGGCNSKKVALTVLGVSSIDWIGVGNGEDSDKYTSNDLCGKDNKATSCKVFPDGRFENGAVSNSKDNVSIKITLSTFADDPFSLHVKSFDADDPSQNKTDLGVINRPPSGTITDKLILDPNDDLKSGIYEGGQNLSYTTENDNRATNKAGTVIAKQGINSALNTDDIFEVYFKPKEKEVKDIVFQVSQFAGDNYQLFAYCDKAHLKNLFNTDHRDGSKIINLSNTGKRLDCTERISKLLTVWRLLHLEVDGMKKDIPSENKNYVQGIVRKMYFDDTGNFNALNVNTKAPPNIISLDYNKSKYEVNKYELFDSSPSLDVGDLGQGRFENGYISIGNPLFSSIGTIVKANGFDSVFTEQASLVNMKCVFKGSINGTKTGNGTAQIANIISTASGYKITLNLLSTNLNLSLVDSISIGNNKIYSLAYSGINIDKTIEISSLAIPFKIYDDDVENFSLNLDMNLINSAYNEAFIQVIKDGGIGTINNTNDMDLIYNIHSEFPIEQEVMDDWNKINSQRNSKNFENDNFWISYGLGAYQGDNVFDSDPNYEYNYVLNGLTHDNEIGTINDKLNNENVAKGYELCAIFLETIRETDGNVSTIFAHEIGHQLGLSHGNLEGKIPEFTEDTMGLMTPLTITSNSLIPRHANLLRSRIKTPGKK